MGKKQDDITDRINDALNELLFDGIIDSDEKAELSRKLGVVLDLPDLLTYNDLREVAIEALAMNSIADAVYEKQQEAPAKKVLKLKRLNNSTFTPTSGEQNVKGVDPGHETGAVSAQGNGGQDRD